MLRLLTYTVSGMVVGMILGVGAVSTYMIDYLDRLEKSVNVYGLNTFLYGCIEGKRSSASCVDITRKNENNITLPDSVE